MNYLILQIWQTTRVSHLDKELKSLKRVVDNLQQRLGINYLDEFDEFQKEVSNCVNHFRASIFVLGDGAGAVTFAPGKYRYLELFTKSEMIVIP